MCGNFILPGFCMNFFLFAKSVALDSIIHLQKKRADNLRCRLFRIQFASLYLNGCSLRRRVAMCPGWVLSALYSLLRTHHHTGSTRSFGGKAASIRATVQFQYTGYRPPKAITGTASLSRKLGQRPLWIIFFKPHYSFE